MREKGFTLVEVLAALVVGGLLLSALGWYVGSLGRDLRRSEQSADIERIARFAPVLANMVEQAIPAAAGHASNFSGSSRRLQLEVPPPQSFGAVGPLLLQLSVVHDVGGTALDATVKPALLEAATAVKPPSIRLIGGMKDISFDYERSVPSEHRDLPRLIMLRFSPKEGVSHVLAMEPRLTANAGCQFDPISMTCRP